MTSVSESIFSSLSRWNCESTFTRSVRFEYVGECVAQLLRKIVRTLPELVPEIDGDIGVTLQVEGGVYLRYDRANKALFTSLDEDPFGAGHHGERSDGLHLGVPNTVCQFANAAWVMFGQQGSDPLEAIGMLEHDWKVFLIGNQPRGPAEC